MRRGRSISPLWITLAAAGIVCLPLVSIPLTAAPESSAPKPSKPTRWERLKAQIVLKDAEYAGNETCALAKCHGDTVKTWTRLAHSQHILHAKEWTEDERSCEGCHGPASNHLTDPQHGAITRLSARPEYVAALCTRCHHEDIQESHFRADVHASAKLSCGACHDVHRDHDSIHLLRGPGARAMAMGRRERKPKAAPAGEASAAPDPTTGGAPAAGASALPGAPATESPAPPEPPARLDRGAGDRLPNARFLTNQEKVNTLCLSCHQQQRGQFHQNSRHPLFEGRMSCMDCHTPHGTGEATLVRHRSDALCVRCHSDKRGPFLFEHDMRATDDGCLVCHQAHGSPNNKLTKLNGRALCLQCHSDINADPVHRSRPGSCWRSGCHADIHGSQRDERFLRAGGASQSATVARAASVPSAAPAGGPRRGGHEPEFARLLALLSRYEEEEATPDGAPATALKGPRGSRPGSTGGTAVPAGPAGGDGTKQASGAPVPAAHSAQLAAAAPPPTSAAPAPSAAGTVAASKPTAAPAPDLEAIGSYQSLGVKGNRSKYYQYTVPPSGVFLQRLRMGLRDRSGQPWGSAEWWGIDEPRQTAALRLNHLGPTGTGALLRLGYDRAAFFIEPSLESVDGSDRRNAGLLYRWVPRKAGLEIRVRGELQRVEAPGISRLATGGVPGRLAYTVERYGPELRLPAGDGSLGLRFERENFTDRTAFLPDTGVNRWLVNYSGFAGANTAVQASFAIASLRQDGLPGDAAHRLARLSGMTALFPKLTASAQLDIEDFRQRNTQNAFVRDRDRFVTRLRYRPQTRLTLEGGYERTGLRRLNNTQTFIDTPRWDGGWVSLRALPLDNITLSARHEIRRLRHAPAAVILELPNTASLLYDDDDRTDAQLSIALPRDAVLYVNYGRNRRQNDARDVGFIWDTLNAGVSLPVNARLSVNADWTRQNWSGRGDPLINDPLRLNFGRPLTSDGNAYNLGFSYLPGSSAVTLNLYRFTASGGESVRSQGIALGFEPRWIGWVTPRFQVGWDDYDDHILSGFNYSDAFFRIDLARRF